MWSCIAQDRNLFQEWIYITNNADPIAHMPAELWLCCSLTNKSFMPNPISTIQAPLAEGVRKEQNGITKASFASWRGMQSGKGLRNYTSFSRELFIISHFRFTF